MKKKRFNTMELFCAAISIGAFLCLWNFGVTGDLGRLMPGPIPVLRKFFETLFGGRIGSKTLIIHPSPSEERTISAASTVAQQLDNATCRPAKMGGIVAGRTTVKRILRLPAPSIRAASMYSGFTFFAPLHALSVT